LSFLNAVLGRSGENQFTSVKILANKSFAADIIGGKSSILDTRAVLQGGTRINVEVQIRNLHNMEKRSLFYWGREFTRSLRAGQDYRKLPKVIAINIINFELLPVGGFHTCFHLRDDTDGILLTDTLEIHYLDMVKWRKQGRKDIAGNSLHRWLSWLDPSSPPELVEEVMRMENAIQKAKERQEYVLSDEETLRLYEMRQLAYWDNINANEYAQEERQKAHEERLKAREEGLNEGREKGRKEGKEEGRREGMENGKMEIARRMKARGRPMNEIAEDTGLDVEIIRKL